MSKTFSTETEPRGVSDGCCALTGCVSGYVARFTGDVQESEVRA